MILEIDLTPAQVRLLNMLAVGGALANEHGSMWSEIARATASALAEADKRKHATEARRKPCQHCTLQVVHSARGRKLPATHRCPHGKRCDWRFPCKTCKELRKAEKCPPAQAAGEAAK